MARLVSWLNQQQIIEHLQKKLKMPYRKINSRIKILNNHHKFILLSIFIVELSKIFSCEIMMISIDKVMFSRNTNFNYSWQHKIIIKNFYNQSERRVKYLIWSVFSTGYYFVYEVKNRNKFWTFISVLEIFESMD